MSFQLRNFVTGIIISTLFTQCQTSQKESQNQPLILKSSTLASKIEKEVPWIISPAMSSLALLDTLNKLPIGNNSYTGLYGFTIGNPIGAYEEREFSFVNDSIYTHKWETNKFEHEVKTVGNTYLQSLIITFFAPSDVLEKFDCPKVSNPTSSPHGKLDQIFKCLPYKKDYAQQSQPHLLNVLDRLQSEVLHSFILQDNWLSKTKDYYNHGPNFYISRPAYIDGGFNQFSGNHSFMWVDNGLITLLSFCTNNYGTSQPMDEDYFNDIESYQNGSQRYPVMKCLITTINEARKNNYSDISKVLGHPL